MANNKWATQSIANLAGGGELKSISERFKEVNFDSPPQQQNQKPGIGTRGASPQAARVNQSSPQQASPQQPQQSSGQASQAHSNIEEEWKKIQQEREQLAREREEFENEKREWRAKNGSDSATSKPSQSSTSSSNSGSSPDNCPKCDSYLPSSWKFEKVCQNCGSDI
eukprot:TRINITY_DN12824_c0_g1_i1.p1 TRINITY_DN12824_c0_g1~~TRINITY_DN12824_c0_g1_i1.p1  ORF type:complete len:167 (-),score=53.38 TRINITY_DN12824_c0_g1_i1:14-514(-)